MKWKRSALVLACFLVYLNLLGHGLASRSQIIQTVNPFDLVISDDLSIQHETEQVIFSVESGVLNGSSSTLDVDSSIGHLLFYAEDSCVLEMQIASERAVNVITEGCSATKLNDTAFTIGITAGSNVQITWSYNLESYADKYTVLAFGLVGIAMMVFSPAWAIRKILSEGVDVDSVEGIGYAILIFIIGLGLFVTFLYW